jgi:hypothetical protein
VGFAQVDERGVVRRLLGELTVDWLSCLLLLPCLPLALGFINMCCCQGCTYFSDDFAADNLATDYDDRAGTWTVGGGLLNTTSASALIVANTTHPSGQATGYAKCDVTCAATTDIGGPVIAYSDDDNYWYAEVQPGATNGSLKLFERSGGVNTQRGNTRTLTGFSAGDTATVSLCIFNGVVRASATHGSNVQGIVYAASPALTSTKGGMRTGAGSSDVDFDNFVLSKHKFEDSTCPQCEAANVCSVCDSSVAPTDYQVVLTGVTDDTGCTNCGNFNATFIVSPAALQLGGNVCQFGHTCAWHNRFEPTDVCCTGGSASMCVAVYHDNIFGSLRTRVSATCYAGGGDQEVMFDINHGAAPDCLEFNNTDVPFAADEVGSCQGDSATCTLTAL